MRTEILTMLANDIGEHAEVKTIAIRTLIWPDHYDCQVFCEDGKVYSSMMDGKDNQLTDFVLVPQQKEAA